MNQWNSRKIVDIAVQNCNMKLFLTILLMSAIWCNPAYCHQLTPVEVVRILDGDTIRVIYNGKEKPVRFIGIDTPETRRGIHANRQAKRENKDVETIIAMGKQSTENLKRYIKAGDVVNLEFDVNKYDRFQRLLAYIYVDNKMLNEVMLLDGYAQISTHPPNVRYIERFKDAENAARDAGRGHWD